MDDPIVSPEDFELRKRSMRKLRSKYFREPILTGLGKL
jgi:hypothetical protein